MAKFVTSDPHFWDEKVLKHRPFSNVEKMNKALITNFNNTISNNDELYIVGDFCHGKDEEILEILYQLNGEKYLIRGNWDGNIKSNIVLSQFTWVKTYHQEEYGDDIIVFNHFPIEKRDVRYIPGATYLHGHTHGNIGNRFKSRIVPRSYNVTVDKNNFCPISLDEILKKI